MSKLMWELADVLGALLIFFFIYRKLYPKWRERVDKWTGKKQPQMAVTIQTVTAPSQPKESWWQKLSISDRLKKLFGLKIFHPSQWRQKKQPAHTTVSTPDQLVDLEPEKKEVFLWKKIILTINASFFIFGVSLLLVAMFSKASWSDIFISVSTGSIGLAMLIFQALYTAFSITSIGPDDQGLMLLYGRPIGKVRSGPVYIPLGILSLIVETKNILEDELPDKPEKIWHGELDKRPAGYSLPIRVTFAPPKEEGKETILEEGRKIPHYDPYNKRLTAEVVPIIQWRICDLQMLVENIGNIPKIRKAMQDMAESVFNSVFSLMTPAEALARLDEVKKNLKENLELLVVGWGIEIIEARVKPFIFSHALNTAVSELAVAEQRALETRTTADAKSYAVEQLGIGEGKGEEARLKGRAAGEMELAKVAESKGGQFAMKIDAAKYAYEKANFAIVSPDNIMGGLFAGIQTFNRLGINSPLTTRTENTQKEKADTVTVALQEETQPTRTPPTGARRNKKKGSKES